LAGETFQEPGEAAVARRVGAQAAGVEGFEFPPRLVKQVGGGDRAALA
jgi:hypothetical protein